MRVAQLAVVVGHEALLHVLVAELRRHGRGELLLLVVELGPAHLLLGSVPSAMTRRWRVMLIRLELVVHPGDVDRLLALGEHGQLADEAVRE